MLIPNIEHFPPSLVYAADYNAPNEDARKLPIEDVFRWYARKFTIATGVKNYAVMRKKHGAFKLENFSNRYTVEDHYSFDFDIVLPKKVW